MAKSKKEPASEKPAEAAKPKSDKKPAAAKKAEGTTSAAPAASAKKAPVRKGPKAGSGAPSAPLVDTSLAAAAAARMVANRDMRSNSESRGGSGLIKHLKDTLSKPATSGPADFLHNSSPLKKSNLPFGGRNQVGHNQTFGADVNRSGVPRRTGG